MEILLVFIGLIIGIMLHDIFKVLKFFLCFLSSYKWIDIRYPNQLPSLENLDFNYILFKFPYQTEALCVLVACWGIFYWIINLIFQKYVYKMSEKQKIRYENFKIENDMPVFFKIVYNIAYFISNLIPINYSKKDSEFSVEKFAHNYISVFTIILHFGIFLCILFNDFICISVTCLTVLLINFIALPSIFGIYDELLRYVEKSLNKT